jgi:membrane protein
MRGWLRPSRGRRPSDARVGNTGEDGRSQPAMGRSHQPRGEELPINHLTRAYRWPADLASGVARALPRAVEDLFRDRCPQYAAAVAFHVLFSLFPLTILLVSIFGLVLQDDDLRARVLNELLDVLPVSESGENEIRRSIEGIASPLSAIGLVSFVALLWGASGMMASIRIGLEAALKVERRRPAARAKLVDFLLVGAIGLLVLVVIGLSAVSAFFSRAVDRLGIESVTSSSWVPVRDSVQIVLVALMTLLLYRVVPARKLRRRFALAGAVLTSIGIWGASKLLAVLLDFSRYNVIYGSLAGVMTFLLFVYVVALLLLLGAEFAYAWSQPPGPPGPPLRSQVASILRGLFAYRDEDENLVSEDPVRKTSVR